MTALRTADEIRDVNTRYHDVAAESYDAKWGIDFGEVGRAQVRGKMRKALGPAVLRTGFDRSLEIGAGTGYFSLNLLQEGVVSQATCTDISPGMLATLADNARRLDLEVRTARAEAESLPFADESFDLVVGHAVLHHIPNLRRAFAEFHRVLRPGGRIAFAGEPSRVGDRIAAVPKRGAAVVAPVWRRVMGAGPAREHGHSPAAAVNGDGRAAGTNGTGPVVDSTNGTGPAASTNGTGPVVDSTNGTGRAAAANGDSASARNGHGHSHASDHDLERFVDIHAFEPADLSRHAQHAGFGEVQVRGEELAANWFGWFNRSLEASADPDEVPMLWRRYAFHGYLALQKLDERLLEGRLPASIFYNLLLSARRG